MTVTELAYFVRIFDEDLPSDLCRGMCRSFELDETHRVENGRNARAALADSGWSELNLTSQADSDLKRFMASRIVAALGRYNEAVKLPIAIPNSGRCSDLIIKRYRAGHREQFQTHFDSIGEVANRYLVFLWYLNDITSGGETRFDSLELTIAPREGRLLMFPPYWMYQHTGLPPISGDKYILSTYLLF